MTFTFAEGDRVRITQSSNKGRSGTVISQARRKAPWHLVKIDDDPGVWYYADHELARLNQLTPREGHRPPADYLVCDRLSARWANGQVRHNCCLVKEHKGTCTCSCGDQMPPDPPTTEIAVGDTVRVDGRRHMRGYVTEDHGNGYYVVQFLSGEEYTFHKNVVHLVAKNTTPIVVNTILKAMRRNGYRIVKLTSPDNYTAGWAHGEAYIEDNQARPLLVVTEELT